MGTAELTLYAQINNCPARPIAVVEIWADNEITANRQVAQALRSVANLLDVDHAFAELVEHA